MASFPKSYPLKNICSDILGGFNVANLIFGSLGVLYTICRPNCQVDRIFPREGVQIRL